MAKPKLDIKKLLLERGERIGLSVAGIITLLLMMVSLLWPGPGLFSGSPDEKAKGLTDPAVFITQRLNDPTNLPGDGDKPDKDAEKRKLMALQTNAINGNDFRMQTLVPSNGGGELGRRPPRVLGIDEAVIKLARMQIQTYVMNLQNGNIYVLKGEKGSAKANQGGASFGAMMGKGGMGGGKGMMGAMGANKGKLGFKGAPRGGDDEKKPAKSLIAVRLEELKDSSDLTLAEQVRPMRMAIIAASFPYKAQLEEFRSKLAMRGANDVFAEKGSVKFNGRIRPSFYFSGVDVERRELDGDGKPIRDFQTIEVMKNYIPWLILSGSRHEVEDPDLKAISYDRLVMPRLRGFRPETISKNEGMTRPGGIGEGSGSSAPPGGIKPPGGATTPSDEKHKDLYPALERDLVTVKKTLVALKGTAPDQIARKPDRFSGNLDPFDLGATPPPKEDDKSDTGVPKVDANANREIPEHCLVRVIDITIQPGKTYEYRLRVRMLNPNFKRPDVASPTYADGEELLPSEWSKTTLRVQVDPELQYYAIDEKKFVESKSPPSKYDGSSKNSRLVNEENQVWVQAHRWLEQVNVRGSEQDVGEWAVADRFAVTRGEYIGRPLRVQLPVWRMDHEEFVIADDLTAKGRSATKGIQVEFGYGAIRTPQPEAIAIDLHNGKAGIDKVVSRTDEGAVQTTTKVIDEAAPEVLLMDPNGRMLLLEGAIDATDNAREERLKHVRERIDEVSKGTKSGGGKTDKPFGGGN